jgi:dihydrofolate synthase / folylpolyglutamate synthase
VGELDSLKAGRGTLGVRPGDLRLFPPLPNRVQWGLDRIQRILAHAGGPHRAYPCLVVAGTNGKGSVAHLWASILQASGFRTGLYTSPHLVSFNERIRVDGQPLPEVFLQEVADGLRSPIVRNQPSVFEASTALALTCFERAQIDVAVLEVGLGGRLDAVNVVEPILTAITRIGFDHEAELGPTLASIAREKAGILRPGVPAFTTATAPEALEVLAEEALTLGLPLSVIRHVDGETGLGPDKGWSRVRVPTRIWGPLEVETPLAGRHQLENITLAIRSLEALPPRILPTRQGILRGAASVRLAGRLDLRTLPGGGRVLLDVAHNLDGVRALCEALDGSALPAPRIGVVGILADKATGPMVERLAGSLDHLVLTVPPDAPVERRWDPDAVARRLQEVAPHARVDVVPDLDRAFELAVEQAGTTGTTLVTGSFFTVGPILRRLDG